MIQAAYAAKIQKRKQMRERGAGSMAYIEFQHVKKFYGKKNEAVIKALDDTNFTVEEGELAVILGASGAGKTTALIFSEGWTRLPREK